jgi:hypothetical protein
LEDFACPHCGHQGLEFQSVSPPSFTCPGCGKKVTVEELLSKTGGNYHPIDPNLGQSFGRQIEPTDEERKSAYFKTFFLDFFLFTVFYVVLCFFFPMSSISWLLLIGIMAVSRIADIVSTLIGLALGAVETNPLSDSHNISKLLFLQVFQVLAWVGISSVLGLISPWASHGVLFVLASMGFAAFFANLGQVFTSTPATSIEEVGDRLRNGHIVSFIIVAIITFVALIVIF